MKQSKRLLILMSTVLLLSAKCDFPGGGSSANNSMPIQYQNEFGDAHGEIGDGDNGYLDTIGAPKGFSTSPSSYDVSNYINRTLSGPAVCQNLNQGVDEGEWPYLPPHQGAWKILASKYQTCRILENERGLPSYAGAQPGILKKWKASTRPPLYPEDDKNPLCRDSLKLKRKEANVVHHKDRSRRSTSPLMYSQGWRHNRVAGGEIKVLEAASDCSSFVSAAFMASGLKMRQGSSISRYTSTTASIKQDVDSGKSCFEYPKSGLDDLLKPGDVINKAGTHVVMIDRVGEDPFLIKSIMREYKNGKISKTRALDHCKNLDANDFDLSIIHSSKQAGSDGIFRTDAKNLKSYSSKGVLIEYARKSCRHFVELDNDQAGFNAESNLCSTCMVLRHKGKKDPSCFLPKQYVPKVQGEGCINGCFKRDS